MKIQPKESFQQLGTQTKLVAGQTYDATHATNQPDWEAKGLIFVQPDGMLLAKGDYTITDRADTIEVSFELTDTFGGEANYSWVRRHTLTIPRNLSDRALVRRAKAWAGWTGLRCKVSNYGDQIDIRPQGICNVLFIGTIY